MVDLALTPAPGVASGGRVDELGPKWIRGWLTPTDDSGPVSIGLFLNAVKIAETQAGRLYPSEDGGRRTGFSISVAKLWPRLGAGDVLEVRCGDRNLPITEHGDRYVFTEPAKSESLTILKRIRAGHVLDRKGSVRPPLGSQNAWLDKVFELFDRAGRIVNEVTGAELFIAYGTLLGCVREGAIIKHDDDFDSFYISQRSTPEAVTEEFAALFTALVKAGYHVRFGAHDTNLLVVRHPDGDATIDIFYGWFNPKGRLGLSYGYHGTPISIQDAEGEPVTARLAGREVRIPPFAEALLEQKYGPNWRIPDHGFAHKSDTRRTDKRYYLDKHRAQKLYWDSFYVRNTKSLTEASTFAHLAVERLPLDGLVIDIGCGTGKDTLFFAEHGRAAVGVDGSSEAVSNAAHLAGERDLGHASFRVVDVSRRADLTALFEDLRLPELALQGRLATVYMRFFLHSISEATEAILFEALKQHLPSGSQLFAEFRTNLDEGLPKAVKERHYRRYVDPEQFAKRLEDNYGFIVNAREESFGWSIYRDEDPHLCRLFATRR